MEDSLILQIIVATVAVLGLCLSIYNLYIQRKDNKPAVKVTMSSCFITSSIGEISPPLLAITAMNTGKVPVYLSSCGIRLSNKRYLQLIGLDDPYPSVSLPSVLQPGKNLVTYREFKKLAKNINAEGFTGTIHLKGFYRDQIDNRFTSKKFKFNIDEWLQK